MLPPNTAAFAHDDTIRAMYLFCIVAQRTAAHLPHGLAFRPHMAYDKSTARALRPLRAPLGNEVTEMKKHLLHAAALAAALALALAACSAAPSSSGKSAPAGQSAAQSVSASGAAPQSQSAASGSEEAEVLLYIGMGNSYAQYTASVPAPAQPDGVIAAIGGLTGWDCTLAGPVEQGDGFVKVRFAQQSALFAGPPEPQKDEFHMYDAEQMCLTFLDSVARTLQANFAGKDGQPLEVYYLPESGSGDLILENIGLAISPKTPYAVS